MGVGGDEGALLTFIAHDLISHTLTQLILIKSIY